MALDTCTYQSMASLSRSFSVSELGGYSCYYGLLISRSYDCFGRPVKPHGWWRNVRTRLSLAQPLVCLMEHTTTYHLAQSESRTEMKPMIPIEAPLAVHELCASSVNGLLLYHVVPSAGSLALFTSEFVASPSKK